MSKTMANTKFYEFFPLTDEGIYGETENYETIEQAFTEIQDWAIAENWELTHVAGEGHYLVESGKRIYALVSASL